MRITEAQLGRLIREALTPPNFRSPTRHSSGWIDPKGEYHLDPGLPDHGEWALALDGWEAIERLIKRLPGGHAAGS